MKIVHGQYQFKTHLFGLDFKRIYTLGTPYNEHAKDIDRHKTNKHEKFGAYLLLNVIRKPATYLKAVNYNRVM